MGKIPTIEADDDMETGINKKMLEQNKKYREKWNGAKRFIDVLESFAKSLIGDGKVKLKPSDSNYINPIKPFSNADAIIKKLYAVKGITRQIEGGFLTRFPEDVSNSKKIKKALKKIVSTLVDTLDSKQKNPFVKPIALALMEATIKEKMGNDLCSACGCFR